MKNFIFLFNGSEREFDKKSSQRSLFHICTRKDIVPSEHKNDFVDLQELGRTEDIHCTCEVCCEENESFDDNKDLSLQ